MGIIFNLIRTLIKTTLKLSLYLAILATVIILIPNLPPYTKFTSIELAPTQARVGPLAPNGALNNAEKLYKGKLLGPEAFQVYNGELYTSLATGEIVKVSPGGHVTYVAKVGQPCTGLVQEHICGRPLGFQIDDTGKLYVADAYHGIWKVDLKTEKKQLLVSPNVEIEKRKPRLLNCIALSKNGDLYWTDSSSDFQLKDGAISLLTDPSGRLLHYDAAKNTSKVLLDDLWFPNGVVLSPNNEFLVVAETSRYRLVKYYLAGPKKGQSEVFVDGLPGAPDNARALPDGSGVLVGLYSVFDEEHPLVTRSLAAAPAVRKLLARIQRLIEIPFEYLNSVYPQIVFQEIVYYIGHFKSVSGLAPPMAGLLQLDWNGNIVASYYNTDETLGHISDAIVYNNKLYTGSPHLQDFIGSVPVPPLLKKAFETTKKIEAPKVETKPVEQKPKQKAADKPKVEQPKVEPKPKVEEKPKVETKPKEVKPKVETKPKEQPKMESKPKEEKPKVATKPTEVKPKVQEKKEEPKVAKPAVTPPKPAQQAKSAEPAKPAPKPSVVAKAPAPATPPPPKTTPLPSKPEASKKPVQNEPKTTTSKPEVKTPTEKTTPPPPKDTTPKAPKTETPKKAQAPVKQSPTAETKPKPIKEEIPSDTAKPTKDTLKVIKKTGPTEIPIPKQ